MQSSSSSAATTPRRLSDTSSLLSALSSLKCISSVGDSLLPFSSPKSFIRAEQSLIKKSNNAPLRKSDGSCRKKDEPFRKPIKTSTGRQKTNNKHNTLSLHTPRKSGLSCINPFFTDTMVMSDQLALNTIDPCFDDSISMFSNTIDPYIEDMLQPSFSKLPTIALPQDTQLISSAIVNPANQVSTLPKEASNFTPMSHPCVEDVEPVEMNSLNPSLDFYDSMMEMVIDKNLKDLEDMKTMLTCYMTLNHPSLHSHIETAFTNLLVYLFQQNILS